MITILITRAGYKIFEEGWNLGTYKTAKELKDKLREIMYARYRADYKNIN